MANEGPGQPVIETSKWTTGANVYTNIIARTTLHGTSALAARMHSVQNFTASSSVIDVGCGTGSLTVQIHEKNPSTPILATDIAEGMLEQVDKLQLPNVRTQKIDGATLDGLDDNTFTHGGSSFALSFIPNPKRAAQNLYRVVKPGGVVGIVLWGARVDWGNAVERATRRIQPDYKYEIPEDPSAWRTPESHRAVLESLGLQNVHTEIIQMPLAADGLDGAREYAFRGGNPVMQKMMSDFVKQGGDIDELERVYAEVLEEEYSGGVSADAVLGWGTKPL